jgi:hypothetical protein
LHGKRLGNTDRTRRTPADNCKPRSQPECVRKNINIEFLCEEIPAWVSHVEKHESRRGFLSHQFGHCLRVALDLDGIIGCFPLVAPYSFPYST